MRFHSWKATLTITTEVSRICSQLLYSPSTLGITSLVQTERSEGDGLPPSCTVPLWEIFVAHPPGLSLPGGRPTDSQHSYKAKVLQFPSTGAITRTQLSLTPMTKSQTHWVSVWVRNAWRWRRALSLPHHGALHVCPPRSAAQKGCSTTASTTSLSSAPT